MSFISFITLVMLFVIALHFASPFVFAAFAVRTLAFFVIFVHLFNFFSPIITWTRVTPLLAITEDIIHLLPRYFVLVMLAVPRSILIVIKSIINPRQSTKSSPTATATVVTATTPMIAEPTVSIIAVPAAPVIVEPDAESADAAQLEHDLVAEKNAHDSTKDQLERARTSHERHVGALRGQVEDAKLAKESLQTKVDELEGTVIHIKTERNEALKKARELEGKCKSAEAEIRSFDAAAAAYTADILKFNNLYRTERGQRIELEVRLAKVEGSVAVDERVKMDARVAELERLLAEERKARTKAETHVIDMRAELSAAAGAQRSARKRHLAMAQRYVSERTAHDKAKMRVAGLIRRRAMLIDERDKAKVEIARVSTRSQELQAEILTISGCSSSTVVEPAAHAPVSLDKTGDSGVVDSGAQYECARADSLTVSIAEEEAIPQSVEVTADRESSSTGEMVTDEVVPMVAIAPTPETEDLPAWMAQLTPPTVAEFSFSLGAKYFKPDLATLIHGSSIAAASSKPSQPSLSPSASRPAESGRALPLSSSSSSFSTTASAVAAASDNDLDVASALAFLSGSSNQLVGAAKKHVDLQMDEIAYGQQQDSAAMAVHAVPHATECAPPNIDEILASTWAQLSGDAHATQASQAEMGALLSELFGNHVELPAGAPAHVVPSAWPAVGAHAVDVVMSDADPVQLIDHHHHEPMDVSPVNFGLSMSLVGVLPAMGMSLEQAPVVPEVTSFLPSPSLSLPVDELPSLEADLAAALLDLSRLSAEQASCAAAPMPQMLHQHSVSESAAVKPAAPMYTDLELDDLEEGWLDNVEPMPMPEPVQFEKPTRRQELESDSDSDSEHEDMMQMPVLAPRTDRPRFTRHLG